jgi:AraC-like DNA-binding protein
MQHDGAPNTSPREFTKFWRDPGLDNLELLHARFVTQSFAPHTHDTYAIGMLEAGAEYFDYRGRREHAGAGMIGIIHPGELHTGGALDDTGWRYRALYPDPTLMLRLCEAQGFTAHNLPFFHTPVIDDPELFGVFWRMHHALETNTAVLERESRLLWALSNLIERYAGPAPDVRRNKLGDKAIARVIDYMHANLAETITLETLASLIQFSKYHVVRSFRDAMQLPPHAYLNQLRIAHAKRLLLKGIPPADVAAQVGFADQAHLTRLFKRTLGVTPGAVAPDGVTEGRHDNPEQ